MILLAAGGWAYRIILADDVQNPNTSFYFYLPTSSNYETLKALMAKEKILTHPQDFETLAKILNLENHIMPGRYEFNNSMNNLDMIRMLRSGNQAPLNLVLLRYRTLNDLSKFLTHKLEFDSTEFYECINDSLFLDSLGFNKQSIISIVIPNTYQFYWNTSARKFFLRMKKEYNHFWTSNRTSLADEKGLSPFAVSVIASIVDEETNAADEKPFIASVYINRLRNNIPLQADPTIKFAMGDFLLKRILKKHLSFPSPYNTYKYKGLPPGPICNPSIESIEAVLHAPQTDFIYFCASAENPGHHVFAKTYSQHLINANKYQHYLNANGF